MSNVVPIEEARQARNRRKLDDVIYSIDPGDSLEALHAATDALLVKVIADLMERRGYKLRVKP